MISRALNVGILTTAGALAAAYGLSGFWVPAIAILLMGVLWIGSQRTRWTWLGWLMMALFSAAAAAGALLGLRPTLLVVGLVGALSAWDLDGLASQLERVDAVERECVLKRRHLRRLLVVDGVGVVCAILALTIRVTVSFGVALMLGLIAILGLSRAIGFLQREGG
jgi:hypothetical protein